jgi:hypothetical protein
MAAADRRDFMRKNARLYRWVAGWWGSSPKIFLLFVSRLFRKSTVLAGAYVTYQHCGLGVAGGHPLAKIAISPGTRLLAGVALASTNAF